MMYLEEPQVKRKIARKIIFLWQQKSPQAEYAFRLRRHLILGERCIASFAWRGEGYPSRIVCNHRKCPAVAVPSK